MTGGFWRKPVKWGEGVKGGNRSGFVRTSRAWLDGSTGSRGREAAPTLRHHRRTSFVSFEMASETAVRKVGLSFCLAAAPGLPWLW